jgi:hypothetical protein
MPAKIVTPGETNALRISAAINDHASRIDDLEALNSREVLTANRTYYVRTDGSDSNTGLVDSAAGAFLTINKAIDTAAGLDLSIYAVTIDVGNGTYTTPVVLKTYVGAGPVTIVGDTSTPSNVVISTTSSNAIKATNVSSSYVIKGLKIQTTTSGNGLYSESPGGYIEFESIDFGACVSAQIRSDLGMIKATGSYSITGSAGDHILCFFHGKFIAASITVTLTGTPAYSSAFARALELGAIRLLSNTYTGSATGVRYSASMNATIQSGGATLPGNVAGTTATGGQYA